MNRLSKQLKQQHGFNVVEVSVVVSVIAIMMIVLAATFLVQLRLTNVMTALSQMQNNRSIIFSLLQQQVHLSTQILPSASINGTNFTTDTETLVLQTPSVDESGVIIEDTYDLVAIYRDPTDFNRLLFDRDAADASSRPDVIEKILTKDLDSINFGYNADQVELSSSIYVHMVLARTVLDQERRIPFDTYLILKNL